VLKISPEAIKKFDEEAATVYFNTLTTIALQTVMEHSVLTSKR